MKYYDFSIVIPSYENIYLFKKAISSIIIQKLVAIEILVVDDSITENISQYCKDLYDIEIKYFLNTPSLGAVKNWNYGMCKAIGKYIILLHHDERLSDDPFQLYKCKKFIEQKKIDICITNVIVEYHNGNIKTQRIFEFLKHSILIYVPEILFAINIIGPTACVIFKKEKLVLFDEQLSWLVDVEWYYRLLKNSNLGFYPEAYINSIYGHANQISMKLDTKRVENSEINYLAKRVKKYSIISFCLKLRFLSHLLKPVISTKLIWKIK